jgi:S-disulfanyl-L-cysteine oxidoreductase SoxD
MRQVVEYVTGLHPVSGPARFGVAALALVVGVSCAPREQATPGEREVLGIGRAATAADIQPLDTDVGPDGVGLPAGSGTVAQGRAVYGQRCASCHGATGREGPFDVLVGRIPNDAFPFANDPTVRLTIGAYWPYATTLYDYIMRAMPFDAPGSLSSDDIYSLVALLLSWNEIIGEDQVMNATTLPAVRMPSRERFVVDDRPGGPVVR